MMLSIEKGFAMTEKSIILVGMMGSGKSSVGRRLAAALHMNFVDVDNEIEEVSQRAIAEIFAEYGEPEFRALESRVLARILSEPPQVIATGGGAFLSEKNRQLIAENGHGVWLDADLETLWSRVKGKAHRPLLQNDNPKQILQELLEKRSPIYAYAEHKVVSQADQSHEIMVDKICKTLGIERKKP